MNKENIKQIIRETIFEIFNNISPKFVFDFNDIPQDELEKQYVDYEKTYQYIAYNNRLSKTDKGYVFESFNEILPPDIVVKSIIKAHQLKEWQFKRIEYCNKIEIYILIPDIGNNVKIINSDMDKMGYFVGQEYKTPNGWVQVHYEPKVQKDETENIKKETSVLYHLTPYYNVENIKRFGLIPKNANLMFNYPERVYCMMDKVSNDEFVELGNGLSYQNTDSRNDGHYVLLMIMLDRLPNDIKFFYDPNMEYAVYTNKPIPSEYIKIVNHFRFETQKFG